MTSTPVKEDFLEVDPEVPGQKFVCLSFVSPEEILKNKDLFVMSEFFKRLNQNYYFVPKESVKDPIVAEGLVKDELSHDVLEDKYKDFVYVNQEELERVFYEKNDFRTTMRAIKVRGVYDTQKEAQHRAKLLQHRDPNFNVFIGQVGYWLPWDPNPHRVGEQEYMEQELNELVKKYKENQNMKDLHFQQNLEYVKEQAEKKAKAAKEKTGDSTETTVISEGTGYSVSVSGSSSDDTPVNTEPVNTEPGIDSGLGEMDPWLSRKAHA